MTAPVTAEKLRELRADGIGWPEIAERYGRTIKHLKAVIRGQRPVPSGRLVRPLIAPTRSAAVLAMLAKSSSHKVARELGVSQSALARWAKLSAGPEVPQRSRFRRM